MGREVWGFDPKFLGILRPILRALESIWQKNRGVTPFGSAIDIFAYLTRRVSLVWH